MPPAPPNSTPSSTPSTGQPSAGRSARKRAQIIAAAGEVFLGGSYAETSVDEIAATAGVSKQTIYQHFHDKDTLFAAALLDRMDSLQVTFDGFAAGIADAEDLPAALRELAHRVSDLVVRSDLAHLRRLVVGEALRFPTIAHAWSANGVGRAVQTLGAIFQVLDAEGRLRAPDAGAAAQQFMWLVLAVPLNTLLYEPDTPFTAAQRHRFADEGVNVFIAAYAPPGRLDA